MPRLCIHGLPWSGVETVEADLIDFSNLVGSHRAQVSLRVFRQWCLRRPKLWALSLQRRLSINRWEWQTLFGTRTKEVQANKAQVAETLDIASSVFWQASNEFQLDYKQQSPSACDLTRACLSSQNVEKAAAPGKWVVLKPIRIVHAFDSQVLKRKFQQRTSRVPE